MIWKKYQQANAAIYFLITHYHIKKDKDEKKKLNPVGHLTLSLALNLEVSGFR